MATHSTPNSSRVAAFCGMGVSAGSSTVLVLSTTLMALSRFAPAPGS